MYTLHYVTHFTLTYPVDCLILHLYQHHGKLEHIFVHLAAVTDEFDMHQCKSHFSLMHFDPF